jgi:hypothetical protein
MRVARANPVSVHLLAGEEGVPMNKPSEGALRAARAMCQGQKIYVYGGLPEFCGHHHGWADEEEIFFSHQCYILKPSEAACFYCGKHLRTGRVRHVDKMTWDHFLPLCQGGVTLPANLVVACGKCNRDKGGRTIKDYRYFRASLAGYKNHQLYKFAGEQTAS